MKIARIKVDGFGVWRDLEMAGLACDVTVLYGPNEAGKTTLMQFVRSLLYGFSPERRERYLPPRMGGTPGGTMSVVTSQGHFDIARRADRGGNLGDVVVTATDGTQQGEPALKAMLGGIDESIFNNVYACGLREIQELGTLSETEAARYLYDLTAGLDRVSLVDVERELAASLDRMLSHDERPSRIGRLISERNRLLTDLDASRSNLARYHRLATEHESLHRDALAAEEQHRLAESQARLAELAAALRDKWLERAEVSTQLAALSPPPQLPPQAIERLEALNRRIAARTQKHTAEQQRRRALRKEAQALEINDGLWRQGPRIEALAGQRDWIASMESHLSAAEAELSSLDQQILALRSRLGLNSNGVALVAGNVTSHALRLLRRASKSLHSERRKRQVALRAIETADADVRATQQEISTRLSAQGETDLAIAMDKCGTLVAQLRRRMQLDERITQMGHQQDELNEQCHELLNRQMLPTGVLIGLGGVFALGTLLVLVGLLMPTALVGTFGWALAILGLCGAGAAGGGKLLLDRAAARELENCQKQLTGLSQQLKQANEEREELDRALPRGGGPLPVRLKTAEGELSQLESLLPLDARRQLQQRETQAARARAAELEGDYRRARRDWRRAVRAAGLPDKVAPRQIRYLTTANHELATLETQRAACRTQAEEHRRDLALSAQRIAQLAADAGVSTAGLSTVPLLARLSDSLAEQELLVERRDQLARLSREARMASRKHARRIVKLQRIRRALLRSCGVENHEELHRRALSLSRFDALSRQRDVLSADIATALDSLRLAGSEEQLARQYVNPDPHALEEQRRTAAARVQTTAERLRELHQQRGRLDEQLRALAADRSPAELRLDLSQIERQLRDAIVRWQELALTRLLLDEIHTQFERDRQPATLREASQYMNRLTSGHYPRIWTPLGQRRLMVDDAAGNSLSPESLSEGTREQLFLSLRLALVARYAKRGIELPLVLDDVLVNFDAERAKSAAKLLRDFAREGHQLLMFTCHEHIVKVFKAAKVETRSLPGRDSSGSKSATVDSPAVEPVITRRRKAKPVVEVIEEEDDVEEEVQAKAPPATRSRRVKRVEDDEDDATYGILGTVEDLEEDEELDDDYGHEAVSADDEEYDYGDEAEAA